MPFYVSPEQIIKDKADYARKGIARGRSVVVVQYADGIAVRRGEPVPRAAQGERDLRPDRVRARWASYNEFENLRVAGVRLADMRGYSYDRRDVTGRGLANAYAQTLGTIFTENNKPYEVEIVVAEVGESADDDQMYRLTFDGSVADEHGFVAMGGQADAIAADARGAVLRGRSASTRRCGWPCGCSVSTGPPSRATRPPASWRWPCSTAPAGQPASSVGWSATA